jgi:uncharacterized protein (TIGR03086 family)
VSQPDDLEGVTMVSSADLAALHGRALKSTGDVVRAIGDDQLDQPSPNEGQSIRELLTHLVAGNLWAGELMAGKTIGEVGDRLDGDVLGDDFRAAYDRSATVADEAFRGPDAMERPVAVSYGPVPGEVYARHRFFDVFVHGWDLAKGTGQDTRLDPELVDACWQAIEPDLDAFRGAGALGPPVEVDDDADRQTRFLAAIGRRA